MVAFETHEARSRKIYYYCFSLWRWISGPMFKGRKLQLKIAIGFLPSTDVTRIHTSKHMIKYDSSTMIWLRAYTLHFSDNDVHEQQKQKQIVLTFSRDVFVVGMFVRLLWRYRICEISTVIFMTASNYVTDVLTQIFAKLPSQQQQQQQHEPDKDSELIHQ